MAFSQFLNEDVTLMPIRGEGVLSQRLAALSLAVPFENVQS